MRSRSINYRFCDRSQVICDSCTCSRFIDGTPVLHLRSRTIWYSPHLSPNSFPVSTVSRAMTRTRAAMRLPRLAARIVRILRCRAASLQEKSSRGRRGTLSGGGRLFARSGPGKRHKAACRRARRRTAGTPDGLKLLQAFTGCGISQKRSDSKKTAYRTGCFFLSAHCLLSY